ncbi:hypothetical protein [Savagea faecisuis]|uniref:Uncharacterized protein n=1 Tax=Savagea faecisuis TaxID=1274803 RepID=A0ABW3GU58_9BACL
MWKRFFTISIATLITSFLLTKGVQTLPLELEYPEFFNMNSTWRVFLVTLIIILLIYLLLVMPFNILITKFASTLSQEWLLYNLIAFAYTLILVLIVYVNMQYLPHIFAIVIWHILIFSVIAVYALASRVVGGIHKWTTSFG